MRSKRATEIRRYAEMKTIGKPPSETRRVIKLMKAEYFKHTHHGRTPPTPGGFFCCQPASAERQRLIVGRFDPKA